MRLEVGKQYRKPNGDTVEIGGPTKFHPESYAWGHDGDWYTWEGQLTGYRILRDNDGRDIGGEHFAIPDRYLTALTTGHGNEQDLKTLYALVRAAVSAVGTEFVVECIWDCHNGRLDGVLCTPGSLHLFRQYRNTVSANPRHLIDAAVGAQR